MAVIESEPRVDPAEELSEPPPTTATTNASALQPLLVLASFGAAALHFALAPSHLDVETSHGVFFLVVAWLQIAWAVAMMRSPSRLVARSGIVLSLAVIGVWIASRTIGIDGVTEDVGWPDTVATGLEAFIALGSLGVVARLFSRRQARGRAGHAAIAAAAIAVVALVSLSLTPSRSGHHGSAGAADISTAAAADGHGAGHAGGADDHAAAAPAVVTPPDDTHGDDHVMAEAVPYDPDMPIDLGGIEGVTPQQQAEAENIVAATLRGLPQWADPAVAEAAGFRSIGDGGTGTEHLVNNEFMNDDIILDPNKPESLVYDVKDGKRTLAAAMYMVAPGTPLADVPKLGGALMQWHTHQNLCYNAQGRVAGITDAQGNCAPGLVKPVETPMIHVWIRPHPCGPFAALEGIGAGAIAAGEERLCDTAHGA